MLTIIPAGKSETSFVFVCVSVCVYVYVCMSVCFFLYVCTCMCVCLSVCLTVAFSVQLLSLIPGRFYININKKDSNLSIIERTCNLFSVFKRCSKGSLLPQEFMRCY